MRDNLCLLGGMDKKLMKLPGGSCANSLTSAGKDLAVAVEVTRVRLANIRNHSDIHRSHTNTLLQYKLLQTFILYQHKITYHVRSKDLELIAGKLLILAGLLPEGTR